MRIEYIDKLKGMAIMLVVMGHVAEKSFGITDTSFNLFYSSFHMPLFMFLSGIFAYKSFKEFTIHELSNFICKKVVRILWPFVVIGGLYALVWTRNEERSFLDAIGGYWFLPALFYCMITGTIANYIKHYCCQDKVIGNIFVDVLVCLIIFTGYILKITDDIPFYLYFAKMYPFFMFGVWFNTYSYIKYHVCHSNVLFGGAILLYLLIFAISWKSPIKVQGFFAIIILINLFVYYDKKIPQLLSILGKYSLEIYVFHWFLLPSLSQYKSFFLQPNHLILNNGNFVLSFWICGIIAVFIVTICLILTKVIRQNKVSRFICFGG